MVELSHIVDKWNLCPRSEWNNVNVIGVSENSKKIRQNFIFVAIEGSNDDGYKYIPEAIEKGAIAIIGKKDLPPEVSVYCESFKVPYFLCEDPRKFLAELAHLLAGEPTKDMKVIGVTGTNGKTTITYMVESILKEAGVRVGRFGTLGYNLENEYIESTHTTPFAEDLVDLFVRAKKKGISHVVMEVSSHSLSQDRVAGVKFDICAFTNLTQDHLDFHKTMDEYLKAKLKLFEMTAKLGGIGIVNVVDPYAKFFLSVPGLRFFTFGDGGDFYPSNIILTPKGTQFLINFNNVKCEVKISLVGKYNVFNALCASAIARAISIDWNYIKKGLEKLTNVPGRFEIIDVPVGFTVVVDYAHTEDGLKNVLSSARELTRGRVITVFGCGGNRDRTKRPKMGYTAGMMSNLVIITSDNPRDEEPTEIIAEIEKGVLESGKTKGKDYFVLEDRKDAIHFAIDMARKDDIVVIAGKGHEPYQIVKGKKIPFDDREVAREYLKEKLCLGNTQ